MASNRNPNSLEIILNYDNRDAAQWSTVWSTTHIPGMDNASGGDAQGLKGRRKLQLGALVMGSFLTMHCRVAASALTGGFFIFMLFFTVATAVLANPLRHFEVYLGQWSISGPGRAFRMLPMFDGIGIAICINALVRATVCCTLAAISAIYVLHAVSDADLPYTYCRDFDLRPYDPMVKEVKGVMLRQSRFSLQTGNVQDNYDDPEEVTVGIEDSVWRDFGIPQKSERKKLSRPHPYLILVCNESYSGGYPTLYSTPPYNFFYVEVVSYRSDYSFGQFNIPLVFTVILAWVTIWIILIAEICFRGRLAYNNVYSWLVVVPWVWNVLLLITAIAHLASMQKETRKVFHIGVKEVLGGMADALEVALYIHSASMGTELIHGKGLNHYASGHIDPHLNNENVWHSGLLVLVSGLHSAGAALCALVDCIQPNTKTYYNMYESTLWMIPMYSKCTLINNYSHLMSAIIFGGLVCSYLTVAFILVKTALHTIFEYRVKLVFAEQAVVATLILSCMGLSLLFTTSGGAPLLECVDAIMTGISMPFICLLELVALLYVYRSHDFLSDINLATEENACASRISIQLQIIPLITLATLLIKLSVLTNAEMPAELMWVAGAPLLAAVLAVPLRAAHNALLFLRPVAPNTIRRTV